METPIRSHRGYDFAALGEWNSMFVLNVGLSLIGVLAIGNFQFLIGAICALLMYWLIGAVLFPLKFSPMRSMVSGGPILALLQLLPIIHFAVFYFSGMLVFGHLEKPLRNFASEAQDGILGFLMVFFSGMPLMAIATAIGYFRRWRAGEFEEKES